jgi:hypothetical protein
MPLRKGALISGGIALLLGAAVFYPFLDMRANYRPAKGRVVSISCWAELDRVRGVTRVYHKTPELPCNDDSPQQAERHKNSEYRFFRRIQYEYVSPVDGRVHRGRTLADSDDNPAIGPGSEVNILVHTSEAGDSLSDPAGL